MTKLSNAQEAFDAAMLAMNEVLEEVKPEAARELAQWNLDIAQAGQEVTRFSTSFDPGNKFEAIAHFDGAPQRRIEVDLSAS